MVVLIYSDAGNRLFSEINRPTQSTSCYLNVQRRVHHQHLEAIQRRAFRISPNQQITIFNVWFIGITRWYHTTLFKHHLYCSHLHQLLFIISN